MKKTRLLCLSVIGLSLTACGPDVDLPEIMSKSIRKMKSNY